MPVALSVMISGGLLAPLLQTLVIRLHQFREDKQQRLRCSVGGTGIVRHVEACVASWRVRPMTVVMVVWSCD